MSSKQITLLGAGYTAARFGAMAASQGHDVRGTTRSPERAEGLRAAGITPVVWDGSIDHPADLFVEGSVVVDSIPPTGTIDELQTRYVSLLDTAAAAGVAKYVFLSSTSVYGDHGGDWVSEESERRPISPAGRRRKIVEDVLSEAAIPTRATIRIAGIYGPGRTMMEYIESGRYRLVNPTKVTNRIHVDDLVAVVDAVVGRYWKGFRAYNAADGHPVAVGELIDFLVENLGMKRPQSMSMDEYRSTRGESAAARWVTTTRVANDRAQDELGVVFKYPNVMDAYRQIEEWTA